MLQKNTLYGGNFYQNESLSVKHENDNPLPFQATWGISEKLFS